jgi:O-antigen/teichoic acid export membrane protein
MVGGLLLKTFFDRRYAAAEPLMIPLAAAAVLSGLRAYGVHQAFHMARRSGVQALTYVPSVIVALVAGFFLIRTYGVAGAANSALLASAFSMVVSIAFALRLLPIAVPVKEVGKVLVATCVMAASVKAVELMVVDGLPRLVGAIGLGAVVYGIALLGLDFMGGRGRVEGYVRQLRRALAPAA